MKNISNSFLNSIVIVALSTSLSASWIINGKIISNEHPLQESIRSIENGGSLYAIDAYQDGLGVFIDGSGTSNKNQVDKNKI